ncbi:glycosyl transferase family 2 [Ulvibacter sp. MAR_2010_11]|uniref:glycosyltransferase family 2 protein n=1 Tax=Ulvibacter sp. MAR_2010_11 TaxID=1250229 RepID=UPI000CBAB72E|nr:glycosyltransferase [Ulvibacter sp. MAR_2010_11]PKA82134.1 glycosyl transferase family 2 [Ulvibacter sp. MAR_2010_11]
MKPIVSVCVQTYNHAPYIKECLNSILMQETTFPFEIVLGEDDSSDGTREICKAYAENYPDKIKLFLRSRKDVIYINGNATGRFNMVENLKASTGDYIALCEGDDYWKDSLKLQKQVEFLEANPQLILCHHWQKLTIQVEATFKEIEAPKEGYGYFPYETDVQSIFENKMRVKSRTLMFRNIIDPNEILRNFPKAAFGDVPLSFVLGKYGRFGFIDEEMAVYRQTNKGASTAGLKLLGIKTFRIQHYKNWIQIWDYADKFYHFKYHKEATETVFEFYKIILVNCPSTFSSFIKVLYYNMVERKLPFHRKLVITKRIIYYYGKKFKDKLKRKLKTL